MSNAIVRAALETRLKSIAEADISPIPSISYQNAPFTKPTGGNLWLEAFLIPTATVVRTTDATDSTFLGLFQVNVWTPQGIGMARAEAVADILADGYSVDKRDSNYPKLSVTGVSTGRALKDLSGWVATPVLINYRYDT